MLRQKVWLVKKADPVLKTILSRGLNVSPVMAQLLINRGIYTVDAARTFLSGDLEDINPPELMQDMDKAVDRISRALKKGEKILVYGDYDADGITATALLVKLFRRLGGIVNYYVPHRVTEGYGLHPQPLERAGETGHTLVVTVDCGISDREVVEQNNSAGGPDIIITDHHEPPEILPPALAILNPKRADCHYPFKELAGVGVALKLGQALEKAGVGGDSLWREFLDLVCLGTVADVVPLQGENRILVKNGLPVLANTTNVGLQALIHISSLKAENMDTRQVAFALAPRLNAAGRMGDARLAVDLLLADNYAEAWELAAQLNRGNQQRQKVESMVLAEAMDMLESRPGLAENKVLVLGSKTWHPGVIGIVASRLLEKFYRPTLLVSIEGETGKGSARSIPGFHMYQALEHCKDRLLAYGGHARAAGFSLPSGELEAFREEINSYADTALTPESLVPGIELDAVISLDEVNKELIDQLNQLWPFGQGNPQPLFACHNVSLLNYRGVGKEGAHLKMLVKDGQVTIDGIGFNLGSYAEILATREVDLAFVPAVNQWNGKKLLQLEVKDIQPAVTGLYPDQDSPAGENGTKPEEFPQYKYLEKHREMFLPGFINRELAKCNIVKGYVNSLPEHTAHSRPAGLPAGLADRRNCPGREEILGHICCENRKTVVIVNCPYQSTELFCFLTRHNLIHPEEALLNPLLYGDARDIIENNPGKGPVKIILSTPDLLHLPENFQVENLVFYHIPYHPAEFYGMLAYCNAPAIYLLYNIKDGETAAGYLHALAPERKFMAGFYNCLRAFSRAGRSGFSAREAMELMIANGFPGHEFSISVALKVFKELQLLDYREINGFQFELCPAPEQKLSLNESPTYKYLQETKTACLKWQRLALETQNPADILNQV